MFNPKSLPFYFNFGCTRETHPISNTEMHAFTDDVVLLRESYADLNKRLKT